MNLALVLLQATEEFNFDELFQQLSRFAVIALFFIGPLLKSIFGKKDDPKKARRKRPVQSSAPTPRPTELEPVGGIATRDESLRGPSDERLEELPAAWRDEDPSPFEREPVSLPGPRAELPTLPSASLGSPLPSEPPLHSEPEEERAVMGLGVAYRDSVAEQLAASARRQGKNRESWRQALVLREILDPPIALRSSRFPHTPPV